jgi:hypothetical protein
MASSGRYLAAIFGVLLSASVGICATADDIVYRDLTKRVKAGDFGSIFARFALRASNRDIAAREESPRTSQP